jgi:hypothetical protein
MDNKTILLIGAAAAFYFLVIKPHQAAQQSNNAGGGGVSYPPGYTGPTGLPQSNGGGGAFNSDPMGPGGRHIAIDALPPTGYR